MRFFFPIFPSSNQNHSRYSLSVCHPIRIVHDFCAQGGDPTGTGQGGESIYGRPFKDEIHQRLRFNRRGLVAMANSGKDDNGSQFFFTLGPSPELDKKHTIFGKVAGMYMVDVVAVATAVVVVDICSSPWDRRDLLFVLLLLPYFLSFLLLLP